MENRMDTIPVALGRLEGKVDILLTRTDNYERRLRSVEMRQWWSSGAAAVAGVMVSKVAPIANILGFH